MGGTGARRWRVKRAPALPGCGARIGWALLFALVCPSSPAHAAVGSGMDDLRGVLSTWSNLDIVRVAPSGGEGPVIISNHEGEGPVAQPGLVIVPVGAGIGSLVGSGVFRYDWQRVRERQGDE
jgi:hypothetical protein